MLGNFSIGDYFKREAITFAWEFLTSDKWMAMEPEKLYVTIHPEDTEAYEIWNEEIGLEESRIIRIEGNFWDIGEGPSGPNTEIFMIEESNLVLMIQQRKCIQVEKMSVILKYGI